MRRESSLAVHYVAEMIIAFNVILYVIKESDAYFVSNSHDWLITFIADLIGRIKVFVVISK